MFRHTISQSTRLNKNALKTLLILTMSFALIIATITHKPQETQAAFPLAIPAGVTIGAGVYTITALGVAAIIGPASPELSEEMKVHAQTTWENSTQLSKDSLNWTIDQATGAGNSLTTLGADYLATLEKSIKTIAGMGAAHTVGIPQINEGFIIQPTTKGSQFQYDSNSGARVDWKRNTNTHSSALGTREIYAAGNGIHMCGNSGCISSMVTLPNYQSINNALKAATSIHQIVGIFNSISPDMEMLLFTATAVTAEYDEIYNTGLSRTREAWEAMRDAGLVLPVDEFVPIAADGTPLTYNADADSYTGIDGGVYTGETTWQIPNVTWRDQTADVPQAGVWVETPVMTGNPTYDAAITATPSITHITTGTTVANPSIPGGGTPTTPTEPTAPKLPGTQPIVPIALMLGLFDLLRAILMYLSRMFTFLVTLPFVNAVPIENPYFQWFRTARILGVQPYPLVMSMATFFMSFAAFKSIRRFLP